jgi:organic hydroperoxide reductase OsmC/OhrA
MCATLDVFSCLNGAHTQAIMTKAKGEHHYTTTANAALAAELHDRAHHFCFIANSVNFPVRCEPRIVFAP